MSTGESTSAATPTEDDRLLWELLERTAESAEDVTEEIYIEFFRRYPEAKGLFNTESALVRGRMLASLFELLTYDSQLQEGVKATLHQLALDHTSYGPIDLAMYQALFESVEEVFERHSAFASPGLRGAWLRKSASMLDTIGNALSKRVDPLGEPS